MYVRDQTTDRLTDVDLSTAIELKRLINGCQLHVFVTPDFRDVYVGGGIYELSNYYLRKADRVEIEALAERFKSPELRRVLEVS